MPKDAEKKRAVGIPESVFLEIEKYANDQKPKLFLYEVLIKSWEEFKKKHCK